MIAALDLRSCAAYKATYFPRTSGPCGVIRGEGVALDEVASYQVLENEKLLSDLFLCQVQAFFPLSLFYVHLESPIRINTLHLEREEEGEREGEKERDGEMREREIREGDGREWEVH